MHTHTHTQADGGHAHLLVHSPNACSDWGWMGVEAGSRELSLGLLCGQQKPHYLSHHLLSPRICIRKKLESGARVGTTQIRALQLGTWVSYPSM